MVLLCSNCLILHLWTSVDKHERLNFVQMLSCDNFHLSGHQLSCAIPCDTRVRTKHFCLDIISQASCHVTKCGFVCFCFRCCRKNDNICETFWGQPKKRLTQTFFGLNFQSKCRQARKRTMSGWGRDWPTFCGTELRRKDSK